ncbi:MAG: CPBP family intramembrane metalloprotease [Acidobacteria bacterium]|nr:CPBP family intramembrane metalloprotease [Acidobacteriota bacterium]
MSVEPSRAGLEPDVSGPVLEAPGTAAPVRTPLRDRLVAIAEVTLCSGFPTQLGLIVLFTLVGVAPVTAAGQLSLSYVVVLLLADAALVLLLVWLLLRAHAERPVAAFVGTRRFGGEVLLGIGLVPAALLIVAVSFGIMVHVAPWLHNVPENPLEALIRSPADAVWFGVVAVVAGGLKEEVQRAFILRRFEQHLGGGVAGLVVFSVAFGLGHLVQGWDAVVATGLLGAFWGIVYLTRRSVVAPIVCHAIFNLTEILIAYRGNAG